MSLIPSESLSFPDDFSRAITRARALSEAKATAALMNARIKRPRARAPEPPVEVVKPAVPAEKLPESQPVAAVQMPAVEEPPVAIIPEPPVETLPVVQVAEQPVDQETFFQQPTLLEPAPIEMAAPAPFVPEELPAAPPIPEKPIITKPAAVKHLTNRPIVGKAFRVAHHQDFEGRPMEPMLGVFSGGLPAARPRTIGTREIPTKAVSHPQNERPMPPMPDLLGPVAPPMPPIVAAPKILTPAAPKMPAPVLPPQEFFIEPAKSLAPKQPSKIIQALSNLKAPRIRLPRLNIHLGRRWTRFLVAEGIALSVLIPTAALALSHYFTDPVMNFVLNILTIAAAAAAGVVPIVFFAVGPTLPRVER